MISQFKSKVGALAQKFGKFRKPKTLKMKAKSALAKSKKTIKNFVKKNPKKTKYAAIGTGAVVGGTIIHKSAQKEIRMRKEFEKIQNEMKSGKNISFGDRYKRIRNA